MRKLVMMLAVLGLLMALPAPAGAKKPAEPPGQEPFPGLTCQDWFKDEDHDDALWLIGDETDDFVVPLNGALRAACIDVSSFEGVWNFKINAVKVASFNMQIKDSVPGDMCWRDEWTNKKASLPADVSTPWVIPKATINACPGDDFTDDADSLVFMVAYGPERGTTANHLTVCVDLPPFDDFDFCPED